MTLPDQAIPDQHAVRRLANAIRMLSVDAVETAKSGHPGLPMGMADVATVLFSRFLKFDAAQPGWPDRDRFVLSAGHGSMLLYSLLWLMGYPEITIDDLKHFRKVGSPTAGHPEYGHLPGIETTTGPLGQGIANAVGMALAERILNARFGDDLVSHKTYVIASDGDLMEGISHEAIGLAGNLKLSNLIVLWDDNNITIDGALSLSSHTDQLERFRSEGWTVDSCDGLDAADIFRALQKAQSADAPVLIACRTIIGFGMPGRQGTQKAHSDAPGADVVAGTRKELDWPYEPFVVPDDILNQWRAIGATGTKAYDAWAARKSASKRAGGHQWRIAEHRRRLGRSDAFQQHQDQGPDGNQPRQFQRPLCPLRHPRAWHGRGDERHGPAWRHHSIRRHLLRVQRLLPPRHSSCCPDGHPSGIRDDPRFHWRG
jgi:transketolase